MAFILIVAIRFDMLAILTMFVHNKFLFRSFIHNKRNENGDGDGQRWVCICIIAVFVYANSDY